MSKKDKKQNTSNITMTSQFKPMTINQNEYVRSIVENDVTICTGPAGSGKTRCPVGLGCSWLANGTIQRIVITRPVVETSRKGLGFLPGSLIEKIHPYLVPILDEMHEYLHPYTVEDLIHREVIDIVPLEYMRGRNFHNCFMILDEAQNATFDQLKMFLTRIGKNTKCVINGDINQSDIKIGPNALDICMRKLTDTEGVGLITLTHADILRSGIISRILDKLEN